VKMSPFPEKNVRYWQVSVRGGFTVIILAGKMCLLEKIFEFYGRNKYPCTVPDHVAASYYT